MLAQEERPEQHVDDCQRSRNDITVNVIASVIASVILLGADYLFGKYKERRHFGKRLEGNRHFKDERVKASPPFL